MPYVSITGLQLKSAIHAPRFWFYAIRAMNQAKAASGNIAVQARRINGVHHTVSVWESRQAMLAYLGQGAHLAAMKNFKAMATGKVLGFEADHAPSWQEVHSLWKTRGREV
jgi:quinol monooxygenase YgiN